MEALAKKLLTLVWLAVWHAGLAASQSNSNNLLNAINGIIQNPVVSCQSEKKKILCLPLDYSKFDLPYRNDFNLIDIGKPKNFVKVFFYEKEKIFTFEFSFS